MDSESASDERIAALEQSLIDERALRAEAQRRVRELDDRAALWRKRAEQRAERISKLEQDRDQSLPTRWLRAARRGGASNSGTSPRRTESPSTGATSAAVPTIPGSTILHNVTGALANILAQGNASSLDSKPWDSADLVVVDPSRLSTDEALSYRTWTERSPRPPTVVVTDDDGDWASADATVGAGGLTIPDAIDVPAPGAALPIEDAMSLVQSDMLVRDDRGSSVGVLVETDPLGELIVPADVVDLAALGVPIGTSVERVLEVGQGDRSRRWSWKHRDPAIVLHQLLDLLGVHHRDPWPSVAGLLVSNRPDRVVSAVDGFVAQGYDHKELVVGCHGFDPAVVQTHLDSQDTPFRVQLAQYPQAWSLGRCLNEAALETTASVLAKIDDDDFYGPHYLLDAILARRYSGAPVIGKAAQFTYVESTDSTVLRRPTTEETFVDGVLTGATLVFDRAVWEAVRFPDRPRMVDVHFLAGARAAGAEIYANSRWEFVYRRSASGHTWDVDDAQFLMGSEPMWSGSDPQRCILTDLA